MKSFLKYGIAAAAMTGAAMFASAPANAGGFSFSIGVPGIGFSYDSGGYCDEWGCPDEYWDMPVYYGPTYCRGAWYQGPLYYRRIHGIYFYWVHGDWCRDEWRGPRPHWWRGHYGYGPALGYEFYRGHGFRHDHDHHWRGDNWWRDRNRDRVRDHRDRVRDHRDNVRDHRDNGGNWNNDNRDHRDHGGHDNNYQGGNNDHHKGGDHGDHHGHHR